jgi:hypothetical protein
MCAKVFLTTVCWMKLVYLYTLSIFFVLPSQYFENVFVCDFVILFLLLLHLSLCFVSL